MLLVSLLVEVVVVSSIKITRFYTCLLEGANDLHMLHACDLAYDRGR